MTTPQSPNTVPQPAPSAFSLGDVYYMLFRHKWKVIICSFLGLLAAAAIFVLTPRMYRSQAKLLVRYVTESAAVAPEITGRRTLTPDTRGNTIIQTELHILTSRDVIANVIERIGQSNLLSEEETATSIRDRLVELVDRLQPEDESAEDDEEEEEQRALSRLARMIMTGLHVNNPENTNVINLEYQATSARLAQTTLRTLIDAYLTKHYAIHRSMGAYEFLAQQVDQTRSRLTQTEEELRTLIARTGFSSAQEAEDVLSARRAIVKQSIDDLRSELAGAVAESEVVQEWVAAGGSTRDSMANLDATADEPTGAMQSMGTMSGMSLATLRRREASLLSVYTEDSTPVRDLRAQIARLKDRAEALASTNNLAGTATHGADDYATGTSERSIVPPLEPRVVTTKARIASIKARIEALRETLDDLETQTETHTKALARIDELQRKKEIEEANYRYFAQSLEQAKIDASLDAEKLANISVVQPATYPATAQRAGKFKRNVFAALAIGILAGLGLAFFTENIADKSVRRPAQVERTLSAPLLLTIPQRAFTRRPLSLHGGRGTMRLLPAHDGEQSPVSHKKSGAKSWTLQTSLKPYFEALRDRVLAFEAATDQNKPTLLGIAGCGAKAGATTMAAGLALTLSRNGDGRVLFVDFSALDHARGENLLDPTENVRLADIFADDSGRTTIMQPNLFVLSATEMGDPSQQIKPGRRIEEVIEQLRSSDYDYIVLDMPPLSETSPSLRIAPLLSGVVLIIEAEKVSQATAQKARKLLDQAHASIIGAILNRKKQYVPRWLDQGEG